MNGPIKSGLLFLVAINLAFGAVVLWRDRSRAEPLPSAIAAVPEEVWEPEEPAIRPAVHHPLASRTLVAIIIDDLGHSLETLEALAELDRELTLAVLPGAPHAQRVFEVAAERNMEAILHLPLESQDERWSNEPFLLKLSMGPEELGQRVDDLLERFPSARGINNHMGSKFLEDETATTHLLRHLHQRGLFFVDSRTSSNSKGYLLARALGMPTARRHVFLDHRFELEAVEQSFDELLDLLGTRREVVAIGHPHESTLEVLHRRSAELAARGGELVRVSKLVETGR